MSSSSLLRCSHQTGAARARAVSACRLLTTAPPRLAKVASSSATPSSTCAPKTHYKITLERSAISLPSRIKDTLTSLGIHRRLQTVYHPHNHVNAGKILRVKELVSVENVSADRVRTKTEQRRERRPPRGFVVVGSKLDQGVL